MEIYTKLRQYYRYLRNRKKINSRKAQGGSYKDAAQQLDFYSQFIKKGDLVFDIGANVGDKADLFLRLGAKVIAVEPQESCWRLLKHRFKNNDVYIVTKGLDKHIGTKEIFVDRSHTLSSMSVDWIESVKKSGRFLSHKWNYKMMVETTTLDALIKQYGIPAFCKIDVEGFEFQVLQGLSQPVNAVSFEFTPEFIDPVVNCVRYLSKLGQAEFNYALGESTGFILPNWINAAMMEEILKHLPAKSEIQGDIYVRFI